MASFTREQTIMIEEALNKEVSRKSIDTLNSSKKYPFHAWCWDKKKRCIVDDYNNTDTQVGTLNTKLRELLGVKAVDYSEFDEIPQYLTDCISAYDEIWASSVGEIYFNKDKDS